MNLRPVSNEDLELVKVAQDLIRNRFDAVNERHTVAASVRTRSGQIVSGLNVFANCGYGPCAEAVVLGLAASLGERDLATVVAVGGPDQEFPILSPCGNCRQLLFEYAPQIEVIIDDGGKLVVAKIEMLLPFSDKMEN